MVAAKICGLTRAEDVAVAVDAGAGAVGAILFPGSKRAIAVPVLPALFAAAAGRASRIAVVVDPDDALLDAVAATAAVDLVQLHGNEPPERVSAVKRRTGLGVVKCIAVRSADDIDRAKPFAGVADRLLFDAKASPGLPPGGNGLAFDWRLLHDARPSGDWGLAGGLTPTNVAEAVTLTGAGWVDAASGVEHEPGIKNHDAVRAFIAAAALH